MKLRLAEAAQTDLAEIWTYLAEEASEAVANRVVATIGKNFDRLLAFPLSGPAREGLAPGLRAAFEGKHVIYYLPTAEELVIVRVLHGARDAAAIAGRGGFRGG